MFDQKTALRQRLRRLFPAALLVTCIALVIVHFTKAISHEITLYIVLSDDLVEEPSVLKMQVTGPNQQTSNATYVIFRLDPKRNTYQHVLNLVSGAYSLSFQYNSNQGEPIVVNRDLDVTTDEMVRIHVP